MINLSMAEFRKKHSLNKYPDTSVSETDESDYSDTKIVDQLRGDLPYFSTDVSDLSSEEENELASETSSDSSSHSSSESDSDSCSSSDVSESFSMRFDLNDPMIRSELEASICQNCGDFTMFGHLLPCRSNSSDLSDSESAWTPTSDFEPFATVEPVEILDSDSSWIFTGDENESDF